MSAIISDCGMYRYRLGREWDTLTGAGTVMWVMLNPSTADAENNDPTIRRCIAFSKAWGYAGLMVGNLYAYRTPSPEALWDAAENLDIVGADNNDHLCKMAEPSYVSLIVCAWGDHADPKRASQVVSMLRGFGKTVCLGQCKSGQPKHPLYLSGQLQPQPFGLPTGVKP